MAVDAEVRRRLLKRLSIGPRALNYRIDTLRKDQFMTREDAACVMAFEQGIDVADRLKEANDLTRINDYINKRKASAHRPTEAKALPHAPRTSSVSIKLPDVEALPGMSQARVNEAKRMIEKVYPMLYVFENSARDLISRVLEAAHGRDWWDKVASVTEKGTAKGRQMREGRESWHSQKRAHPVYYADLSDLAKIVSRQWPHFRTIFPRSNWFDGLVDDFSVSRNEVAHMNPITTDDVKHLESGYAKWVKVVRAKAALIP
jgi:hypothetical protein